MIIRIDPKIDCVFKAILGMKGHEFALIHFLNAILLTSLGRRIIEVVVLNPFNPKEFLTDKLSIVDIKARDEQGTLLQIEMQMVSYASLKPRMFYGWSTLYASQLQEGVDYGTLRPVICVWPMVETVFREMNPFHLHFELMDRQRQRVSNDHFALHVIQLNMWDGKGIRSELDRWPRFFLEGQDLDPEALPDWMKTPEMALAMETLVGFREKEEDRLLYESRLAYTREHEDSRGGSPADLGGPRGGVSAPRAGGAGEVGGAAGEVGGGSQGAATEGGAGQAALGVQALEKK